MTKKKITYKDVDWESYRENVENSIANERLWATEFSRENIANLEDELDMIDNEEFEELFNMYDEDIWERYLLN
jgi:hypothetical protein